MCQCGHEHEDHGPQGFCMVWGCRCMGYAARLSLMEGDKSRGC